MPYRRKTVENGIIYDGNIPYSKQADSGKIPVVNASGEWELGNGPSGGGFLVTLTESEGTYTADKTFAEISASVANGIIPILKAPEQNSFRYYPFSYLTSSAVSFSYTSIESGEVYTAGYYVWPNGSVTVIDETYPTE